MTSCVKLCWRARASNSPLLQTLALTTLLCICVSSSFWRFLPNQPSPTYTGPTALYHEQTIAVVNFSEQTQQLSQCRLILAENHDQFEKQQLLNQLAARMPVKIVTFLDMMQTIQSCQNLQNSTTYNVNETKVIKPGNPRDVINLSRGILPGLENEVDN